MRHHKLTIVSILGSLAVIVALLVFSKVANAPSKATVITQSNKSSQPTINLTPVSISNAYASFDYPEALRQTPSGGLMTNEVAAYTFLYRDLETWSMAIEIVTNQSGLVSDNNAYQFRKVNPQTYAETDYSVNDQPVVVMTDKTYGGFSKVAFLVHGSYQAIISLYGDDPGGIGNLSKTFNMVINSWQWNE
jgi:hypothetical protein